MDKIETTKPVNLLEEGVDELHRESQQWLSDLAFWKDEVAFYDGLIVRKTLHKIPSKEKDVVTQIEGDLIRITGGELEQLQQDVELHEYYLSQLLRSFRPDEEPYREKHKTIKIRVQDFEKKFKELKTRIFKLTR
jgi:hypothetical protein